MAGGKPGEATSLYPWAVERITAAGLFTLGLDPTAPTDDDAASDDQLAISLLFKRRGQAGRRSKPVPWNAMLQVPLWSR